MTVNENRIYKAYYDFGTGYRVWVNETIPGRVNEIRACGGDLEYTMEMIKLTLADAKRLIDRSRREQRIDNVERVYETAQYAIEMYVKEVRYDSK